jgi:hypothetical protein
MMKAPLGAVYPSVNLKGFMATWGTMGAGGRNRKISFTTYNSSSSSKNNIIIISSSNNSTQFKAHLTYSGSSSLRHHALACHHVASFVIMCNHV